MKLAKKWRDWYIESGKKYLFPLLLVCFAVVAYFLVCQMTKPESYNVKLFQVAEKTIRSPQTVEDTEKTKEERTKASDAVEDVYVYNRETGQNRVALIQSLFAYVNEVNAEAQENDNKNKEKAKKENKPAPAPTTTEDKLKSLKDKLSSNVSEKITSNISDEVFTTLIEAKSKDFNVMEDVVTTEVAKSMENKIRDENLNSVKIRARDDIELSAIPAYYKNVSKALVSYAIVPNEIYDEEQTDARRKEAAQSVVPVKILQGQVIVQEGQIVDRETYRQLKMLHLLDQKMPVKQYAGFAIFIMALAAILFLYTKKQSQPKAKKMQTMLIFSSVYLVSLFMLLIILFLETQNISNIAFLFPAAFAPMILKILLNEKYAFLSVIFIAVTSLLTFQNDATSGITIFILLSGATSVVVLRDYSRRSAIMFSGFMVGLINMVYVLLLLLINNSTLLQVSTLMALGYAFLGGFGAFILGVGVIPLFETIFGLLTTSRLVELANPNHPLLKKILMKAPGTYHHSMMVANLAEACADKIGANSLLVRVGCFYHDIGKTLRPPYFVENQLQGINPHDRLTPEQSRDIILSHTKDGAEILKENHMPQPIIDIALQHHGTTLLKYFYFKAKETNPDVKEADYRYSGPKPQTKEIAIINISDSVEAAVRSSTEPTMAKITEIIDGIIKDRFLDGQFTECDITIQEIKIIRDTLIATLNGIYHQRIQYPDDKD
ncbi:cyclic-di-AMP phosphodiesterase PgpH [Listeria monocytogenes]|uniref:cyclic-di-AMP phosphodiesterase PgpH n=1 Tax=Listeria monocytogenes TaxID=1639 RepID=UPI000874E402|nr:cyclic-di-AMP phosphodiesterase PgpH [Listeria monocytogenes]EAC3819742.1 cyclic-di-AMP phosphodiesterase PgpH [Listeria monocytogenes]EAD0589339.1 cyclic-di-AMP phosphodiesterase PgpH [Listeria monocytogenes]EAD0598424.1 cyclic-di-AMP phosphodiesterase PgpH [Listeria monocytogenes]EAD6991909.1 cyclic-di-AMP phosphodiesterase PgpH [Listeria monocytogenes]EAD8560706.1 cyclic-di-AMP phosphodiesterase PgpH [Listeria monocytogenes]